MNGSMHMWRDSIHEEDSCTHCGKTNHIIDSCNFIHGFPRGYQTKNNKPGGFASSIGTKNELQAKTETLSASNGPISLTQH